MHSLLATNATSNWREIDLIVKLSALIRLGFMLCFVTELSQANRMEVEISSHSFDCSSYGPATVVADDSHVVLLRP